MVSVVEEEPHPEDSVNFLQPAKLYELDYSSGEDNTVAVIENAVEKVEPLNMPIKIGNINTTLLVDFGSACSILNRPLASLVVQSSPCVFWISEKTSPQLRVTQSTSHKVNRVNNISSPEFKEQIAKLFLSWYHASEDQKTMWQNLSFTKTSNLVIKKVDVFQFTYRKKSIMNLRNC